MTGILDTTPLKDWGLFPDMGNVAGFMPVIAGPCSAESEKQVLCTAGTLRSLGINVFRAGIWKPRTHPGSFEGVGERGLEWLRRVQTEYGMKVATEVAGAKHVEACLKSGVDLLWIGARTSANPFLVQEIADALSGTDLPVLVKNPVSPDMDLWTGALERLHRAGVRRLGVIHRGFSTAEKGRYRNEPLWQYVIEFRSRFPQIPVFCDPSHIAGSKEYIEEISQRAVDLGVDGLMLEAHCNPEAALSDAAQQLTPDDLADLLHNRLSIRKADTADADYRRTIGRLREEIDVVDENLVRLLSKRMEISRRIGQIKRENKISIIQTSRWDKVLASVVEKGREEGLDEDFVRQVFNAIHEASIKAQA